MDSRETLGYPSSQERALLVVENASLEIGGDAVFMDLLENNFGFNVVIKDENHVTVSDTADIDFILVSSTVMSNKIGTMFTNVSIPLMTTESHLFDDLGMLSGSASYGSINSTSIEITDPTHELVAGMSGTQAVYTTSQSMAYGQADTSAHQVAQIPSDPDKVTIFYYEPGESMPGLTAPARRMAFFTFDDGPNYLTAEGMTLLTNTIQITVSGSLTPKTFVAGMAMMEMLNIR